MPPGTLPERVVGDQPTDARDRLVVSIQRKLRIDPIREGCGAELIQPPNLVLGKRLVAKIGERLTSPQTERPVEGLVGEPRVTSVQRRPAGLDQALECAHIDRVRRHDQPVTRRTGLDLATADHLSQPGHIDVDALPRVLGRGVCPQLVDDPVDRDRRVSLQQEQGEQRTLVAACDDDRPAILGGDVQRTEQPEPHICRR